MEGLRQQSGMGGSDGRVLRELKLEEPIRYGTRDPVEAWLHELLCLNVSNVPSGGGGCPDPQLCNLYVSSGMEGVLIPSYVTCTYLVVYIWKVS